MRWSSVSMKSHTLVRHEALLGVVGAVLLGSLLVYQSARLDTESRPSADSATPTAPADQTPRAARASGAPVQVPVAADTPSTLTLQGGATLQMPAGASATQLPGGLSEATGVTHAFRLPGGRRRLAVSELPLEGKGCRDKLDEHATRIGAAQKETDPQRSALRRVNTIEDRMVSGHRVLYTESMQGTSLSDAGAPFAAVASAAMCEGQNLLLMLYVSDEGTLDSAIRPMLDAMVASYRSAGAAR
jgi:hypothetical protein